MLDSPKPLLVNTFSTGNNVSRRKSFALRKSLWYFIRFADIYMVRKNMQMRFVTILKILMWRNFYVWEQILIFNFWETGWGFVKIYRGVEFDSLVGAFLVCVFRVGERGKNWGFLRLLGVSWHEFWFLRFEFLWGKGLRYRITIWCTFEVTWVLLWEKFRILFDCLEGRDEFLFSFLKLKLMNFF